MPPSNPIHLQDTLLMSLALLESERRAIVSRRAVGVAVPLRLPVLDLEP